jgi:hypothetical protein
MQKETRSPLPDQALPAALSASLIAISYSAVPRGEIGQVCKVMSKMMRVDPEKDEERVEKLFLQLAQTLAAGEQLQMARSRDPLS